MFRGHRSPGWKWRFSYIFSGGGDLRFAQVFRSYESNAILARLEPVQPDKVQGGPKGLIETRMLKLFYKRPAEAGELGFEPENPALTIS